jgi:hypothetical protein
MQHVSAFSSPQTVPAAPGSAAAGRKPNLWILDSWRDLILYVCTPLLLVPIFIGAQGLWAAEDIYLFVAAFGAMGHHLPGMIAPTATAPCFSVSDTDSFSHRFSS